jgi:hypothetical protein
MNKKILYIMQAQRKINNIFHYPTSTLKVHQCCLDGYAYVERTSVRYVKHTPCSQIFGFLLTEFADSYVTDMDIGNKRVHDAEVLLKVLRCRLCALLSTKVNSIY